MKKLVVLFMLIPTLLFCKPLNFDKYCLALYNLAYTCYNIGATSETPFPDCASYCAEIYNKLFPINAKAAEYDRALCKYMCFWGYTHKPFPDYDSFKNICLDSLNYSFSK